MNLIHISENGLHLVFEKKEDVPTSAFTMGIGTILKAKKILLVRGADNKDIIEKVDENRELCFYNENSVEYRNSLDLLKHCMVCEWKECK